MTPEQIEIEGMRLIAPARACDQCPQDALYFIEYRTLAAFCPVCYERRQGDFRARMAGLLDMLLGGPVTGGGILDEMRTVRSELKEEGY